MEDKKKITPMKTTILMTAVRLFYDNGYNATSFEHIAKECDITKPLITYHYKTKANLATEVNANFSKKRKNAVAKKIYSQYGSYDDQIGTAIGLRLLLKTFKEDSKAYRFFHERVNAGFDYIFTDVTMPLYETHARKYNLNMNNEIDELKMCALSAKASSAALNVSYFSGKINCSFEDYSDYIVNLQFKLMNIPQHHIDHIVNTSKKIMTELDFKIAPYYEIY